MHEPLLLWDYRTIPKDTVILSQNISKRKGIVSFRLIRTFRKCWERSHTPIYCQFRKIFISILSIFSASQPKSFTTCRKLLSAAVSELSGSQKVHTVRKQLTLPKITDFPW